MREQIIYRLFGSNDLLIDNIQKIASDNKIKKAVILSFIGSAKKVSLSNLKDSKDKPEKSSISLEGTFEIISMTGHIIPIAADKIRVHMHITLAKEDGSSEKTYVTEEQGKISFSPLSDEDILYLEQLDSIPLEEQRSQSIFSSFKHWDFSGSLDSLEVEGASLNESDFLDNDILGEE